MPPRKSTLLQDKETLHNEYVWMFIGALAAHDRIARDSIEGFIAARKPKGNTKVLFEKIPAQTQAIHEMLPLIVAAIKRNTHVQGEDKQLQGVTLSGGDVVKIWNEWSAQHSPQASQIISRAEPLAGLRQPELRTSIVRTLGQAGIGADDANVIPDLNNTEVTEFLKHEALKGAILHSFYECLQCQKGLGTGR